MSKTKQQLQEIKQELMNLTEKLKDLNEDELNEVTGGNLDLHIEPKGNIMWFGYTPKFNGNDQSLSKNGLGDYEFHFYTIK